MPGIAIASRLLSIHIVVILIVHRLSTVTSRDHRRSRAENCAHALRRRLIPAS